MICMVKMFEEYAGDIVTKIIGQTKQLELCKAFSIYSLKKYERKILKTSMDCKENGIKDTPRSEAM